jgi:2,3-bisphosphoglycerate-independent phosphoglycerate mutase
MKTSSVSNLQNCGHCTKAKTGLKGHSRHPVPRLLVKKTGERDGMAFHERNYVTGSLGTIYSKQLMPLVLPHGLKLDKYGA